MTLQNNKIIHYNAYIDAYDTAEEYFVFSATAGAGSLGDEGVLRGREEEGEREGECEGERERWVSESGKEGEKRKEVRRGRVRERE